jgi:PAS domain-containing protein
MAAGEISAVHWSSANGVLGAADGLHLAAGWRFDMLADLISSAALLIVGGTLLWRARWESANRGRRMWRMVGAALILAGSCQLVASVSAWSLATDTTGTIWGTAGRVAVAALLWAAVLGLVSVARRGPLGRAVEGPSLSPSPGVQEPEQLKRAEYALQESEAIYASLVDSLPLNMLRKDMQGRLVFANKRYCEMLKMDLADLMYKTDWDLFPDELARKYRQDDVRVKPAIPSDCRDFSGM